MINLKVTLGTVNYTDYLHVTASKVSAPNLILWEDWIDVPVMNYNFIIPNLDPENYYVRYYDSPNDSSLGTLVAELVVNAITSEVLYERRFYSVGGAGEHDPAPGSTSLEDPYLIGKNVTGVFKEGFRYLWPDVEYSFDSDVGKINILYGVALAKDEVFIVELKYNVGVSSAPPAAPLPFTTTIDVEDAEYVLSTDEIDCRLRCAGLGSVQSIELVSLASIPEGRGWYLDNSSKGVAVQVKILTKGSDKLRFTGFMTGDDLFSEIWVSKGDQFKIIKSDGVWEIIGDYKGMNVGERIAAGFGAHPNTLPENGSLIDGDEYPRLWWWLNNVLPANFKYQSASVTDVGFTHTANRRGQFCLHPTLKKFRMPDTTGLVDKGLASFDTFGSDVTNRPVDYPGGFQAEMVGKHTHPFKPGRNGGIDSNPNGGGIRQNNTNPFTFNDGYVLENSGTQNRVDNNGVIFLRRI